MAAKTHSSVILLWNCVPTTSSHQRDGEDEGCSLAGILGLDCTKWPLFVNRGTVVEHRELVVPLQAALSEKDRSARMLVNVLAVVRHLGPQRQFTTCNPKDSEGRDQRFLDQSSVVVVAESICENALSAWAAKKSYRVDEIDVHATTAESGKLLNKPRSTCWRTCAYYKKAEIAVTTNEQLRLCVPYKQYKTQ